jgi:hypothetical protein
VVGLLSAIVSTIAINNAYVDYHDTRYIKRTEAMTIAAASELAGSVTTALEQGADNSKKLDWLLIQTAQREVYDSSSALRELEKTPRQTLEYHDALRDAVKRADTAKVVLDCLRASRPDCEKLRGL